SASAFMVIPPNFLNRFVSYADTPFLKRVEAFCLAQPKKWRAYLSLANQFRSYLQIQYGKNIEDYNTAKGTAFAGWDAIPVGPTVADCPAECRDEFLEFLRLIVNPVFLRLKP